tara:strand:+ start:200 stop:445 length:246 start_codon:yes stop_codon:yes gene_type:complete
VVPPPEGKHSPHNSPTGLQVHIEDGVGVGGDDGVGGGGGGGGGGSAGGGGASLFCFILITILSEILGCFGGAGAGGGGKLI